MKLDIFADYYQFYIQDENVEGDLSDAWNDNAVSRKLALTEGTVGIGTARNSDVPVEIDIVESSPEYDIDKWDMINECCINIPSGSLVIAGCTDYFPDATRIKLNPGIYGVSVLYENLNDISDDGLEGNDFYKIFLWKINAEFPLKEIK